MIYAETTDGYTTEPVQIEIKNVAYNEAHVLNFEIDMEKQSIDEDESVFDSEENVKNDSSEEEQNKLEV